MTQMAVIRTNQDFDSYFSGTNALPLSVPKFRCMVDDRQKDGTQKREFLMCVEHGGEEITPSNAADYTTNGKIYVLLTQDMAEKLGQAMVELAAQTRDAKSNFGKVCKACADSARLNKEGTWIAVQAKGMINTFKANTRYPNSSLGNPQIQTAIQKIHGVYKTQINAAYTVPPLVKPQTPKSEKPRCNASKKCPVYLPCGGTYRACRV